MRRPEARFDPVRVSLLFVFALCFRWCVSKNSCGFVFANGCPLTEAVLVIFFLNEFQVAYDCPRSPQTSFEYNETFARAVALPLCAATYATDPAECLRFRPKSIKTPSAASIGIEVTKHWDFVCDPLNNTCSAFTGISPTEKAVVLGLSGCAIKNCSLSRLHESSSGPRRGRSQLQVRRMDEKLQSSSQFPSGRFSARVFLFGLR